MKFEERPIYLSRGECSGNRKHRATSEACRASGVRVGHYWPTDLHGMNGRETGLLFDREKGEVVDGWCVLDVGLQLLSKLSAYLTRRQFTMFSHRFD